MCGPRKRLLELRRTAGRCRRLSGAAVTGREPVLHLRVRRLFCREVSLGQEVHHELIEVLWALQRHQV
jgi:hypothetical protein